MKITKRVFTLFLSLTVLLAGISIPTFTREAKAESNAPSGIIGTNDVGIQPDELLQSGEWLYYLDGDEAIIAGYDNLNTASLKIPYRINGHTVSGISEKAFYNLTILKSVEVHSLITRIADNAFQTDGITIKAYSGSYAITYAEQHHLQIKNLTNPCGSFYVKNQVIDPFGFPKGSIEFLNENSIRVSHALSRAITKGNKLLYRDRCTSTGIVVLNVINISKFDTYCIIDSEYADFGDNGIDYIKMSADCFSIDPSSIEVFDDGITVEEVSSSWVLPVNAPVNDTVSFNMDYWFTKNLGVKGSCSAKFKGYSSLIIQNPAPFVFLIQNADINVVMTHKDKLTLTAKVEDSEKFEHTFAKMNLVSPIGITFSVSLKIKVSVSGSVTISMEGVSDVKATCKNYLWNVKSTPSSYRQNVEGELKGSVGLPFEFAMSVGASYNGFGLEIKFGSLQITPQVEITAKITFKQTTGTYCTEIGTDIFVEVSAEFGILEIIAVVKLPPKVGVKWKHKFPSLDKHTYHVDHVDGNRHIGDDCFIDNREVRFVYENGQNNRIVTADACTRISNPGIPTKEGFVFGGWYFSTVATDGSSSGNAYKWDFDKFKLPYFPHDGYYKFEAKWVRPGDKIEDAPDVQPDGESWDSGSWGDGSWGGGTWHYEPPKPVEVTGITLNKTDEVLHVDGQYKDKLYLYAVVSPANADDTSVTWSSSNPAVATVDQNGVVSAVAQNGDNHETIITCTSNMCPSVSASCKVNVFEPIYVNSITLDKTSTELWANETENSSLQLNATVDPANATYSSVHWSSSDEGVAWVDGWGKVTALSAGTATITCRSVKNQDVTATCQIMVHQHVRDIYVTSDRDGLLPTETVQLNALCYPTNADNKSVSWNSSDSTIASVDASGLVTAMGYGEATITATAKDGSGISGSQKVTVEHELTLIGDVQNDTIYLEGENSVIIGYAYATQGSVRRMVERGYDLEWTLLNEETEAADAYMDVVTTIYTVNGRDYEVPSVVLYSGELHRAGDATFTLQCKAGSYTATVDLATTVSGDALAKSVTLNPSKFELELNEVAHIPSAPIATDGGVVPRILSVSMSGDAYYRSHAHLSSDDQGLCVWFPESGQYTADVVYRAANIVYTVPVTFEVRDEDGIMHLPVTDVVLSDSFVNMVVGDTYQLSAEVSPVDAYDRTVTWTSEDEDIAEVSSNGLVTAKSRGMVYIRCEANDGSGYYDSCVLNIEPFMALNETSIEKTIYRNGQTHVAIDSCSLTYQSAIRIEEAGLTPNWTLQRVVGDATEIALSEFTSVAEGNVRIESEEIQLLRADHTGIDRYQLVCEAGGYSASCDIILTVIEGENLPESISLVTDSYVAEIGEEIEIDTSFVCSPDGSELPEDVSITIDPTKAFWNAMEEGTYFADYHCTFAEAGEYTAQLVYSGANYRYSVPFTVRVKDEAGNVPVAVQDIVMSEESVQLLVGDTVQLNATVLPENAAYGSITWSSFDTSVATVSTSGKVTAMDAGITYIVASSEFFDQSAICLVTVEDGLTLESDSLTKTVYVDGATRMTLDTVFLTESSSRRLDSAPEWKLQRVSGNNLTLRASGTESVNEGGDTLYGCNIILHSASAEGQTVYDLVCASGNERATMRIVVNAVSREGNIPANIELSQTSYEADVGELIVVSPEITCWPSGTQLPEGTRVEFVGDRQFLEAVNQQDWFVSQSISTFSFTEAGRYEANCIYSYANISYTIPITFYIKDGNGTVPVHGRKMSLNTTSLQLVAGDESQLTAVFTPADVTDSSVTWAISDTGVATVDSDGHVRAVANGTAEITCTPTDTHCSAVTCYVTVEDYLSVETGNTSYSCYLEGEPDNLLSSAWLSEGTRQRMRRDGIIPTWTLTVTGGNSAVVVGKPEKDGSAIRVSTTALVSAGTTSYSITCNAGDYRWAQDYSVVVNTTGLQVPEHVTLATPEINLSVGEVKTINFAPVCQPSGTSLPQNITTSYVGIGGFYAALDRSVFDRNGDNVTVAFTKPGRYLLTRVYRAQNLDYTALCVINVGDPEDSGYGLLQTTEQECTVFMNGKSGVVADVAIYDATVYERFGNELQWNVERLSGNSISAGLVANADKATLIVADAERTGTDVWRVSCTFGGITDFVDITIEVKEARKPIPTSIELSKQRVTGMTGDWLHLPLGVKCNPEGSALPETGDDFWSFAMLGGLAEDVSESRIENGMLSVCFSESGYYTGNLTYRAGTISYTLPVYFTVSDEESHIETPDQLKVWIFADSNTVYPEGDTNVAVATAVLAENLNSYYAGTAPSYAEANGITWSISVNSGNAAALSIQRNTANTADILLNSIEGIGDVQYTVSATVNGTTYTGNGTLHVASSDEARPDVTLKQSRYQITQGVPATISRMLYQRSNGGALQSAGEWNVGSALAAIGYSYETTDDSWKVTFYKKGEYTTTVSAYVGNLRYDLPLTITVVGKDDVEQYRTLKLPAALTIIEEEAFSGLTVQVIDLRGTKIKTIANNAFRNCVDLVAIYIPNSVTSIADNAFYGCLNVTIHCVQGSNADSYASEHGLSVSYDMD